MPASRRKPDDAPGLFGDDPGPPPEASPYPAAEAVRRRRAAIPDGPVAPPGACRAPWEPAVRAAPAREEGLLAHVARLAAEVIGPVVDALERAHGELAAGRPETARAILAVALEDAGRRPAGGTEAA